MALIGKLFQRWEKRLAKRHGDVKDPEPFSYGLHHLGISTPLDPIAALSAYADEFVSASEVRFGVHREFEYGEKDGLITFRSRVESDFGENNTVRMLFKRASDATSAVLALPHWNAAREEVMALSKLTGAAGHSCAILSLPYHDERCPSSHSYAKGLVSSDIGRTLSSMTQATYDAIDAISILHRLGCSTVSLLGTSIGACVASLVDAHDPRPAAVFLNLMASDFAECVWGGISTSHIREALDGNVTLDELRSIWKPISPGTYVSKLVRHPRRLRSIVAARYDCTFPRDTVVAYRHRLVETGVPHVWSDFPCGHYTLGQAPFKYCLALRLFRLLRRVRSHEGLR